MKKVSLILFFCEIVGTISAQEKSNFFLMFLHGGYGILPDKTSGLTNSSASYIDELSSGVSWNAQAYFRHKALITGLFYSGYTAKGSLENSSDKILTSYVAPQLGAAIPVANGKFDIVINAGVGGIWYQNNSMVFGKERKVRGSSVGVNIGLKGVYNFSRQWGVSLEMATIRANLYKTNVNYHYKTIDVKYSGESPFHLDQFTFSIGLKYSL